ncbi:MAG: SRPBCC domain-containing protein, partial [Acidimicrobiales bacterium]
MTTSKSYNGANPPRTKKPTKRIQRTMSNNATKDVQIERTLSAPVSLVWQMWTVPEHFKAWYGPGGATIPVAEFDLTIGG